MNEAEILSRIQHYGDVSHWITIGALVNDLELLGTPSAEQVSWLRVVTGQMSQLGHKIGLSHAYKIVRTYRFLRKMAENHPDFHPDTFNGCPIGAIEIAVRIYKFDKNSCLDALRSIRSGASAADIQKKYEFIKSAMKNSLDARNNASINNNEFTQLAIDSIRQRSNEVFDSDIKCINIYRVKGRRKPNGVIVSFYVREEMNDKTAIISGFEVININNHSSSWALNRPKICFNSTFFQSYWIIARCDLKMVEHIKDDLDRLMIRNIGIIIFDKSQKFEIYQRPTSGPVPNRSRLF